MMIIAKLSQEVMLCYSVSANSTSTWSHAKDGRWVSIFLVSSPDVLGSGWLTGLSSRVIEFVLMSGVAAAADGGRSGA